MTRLSWNDEIDEGERAMQKPENMLIGGRYQILDKMAHAGKCRDMQTNEMVWLKPLPSAICNNPILLEDAVQRCEALKKINHPAIARMQDVTKADDGVTYMVMEYAEGVTLRQWMQSKRQNGVVLPDIAMPIIKQLADALKAAHALNELHRHLTPDCIMVDDKDNAKILNYGIPYAGSDNAWMLEPYCPTGWEAFYRAPEQWCGQICMEWTDMYALGCIAYEMLSGHVPFDIPDLSLLQRAVLNEMPPAIFSLNVSAQSTIARSLAKRGNERYRSFDDFLSDLTAGTTWTKSVPRLATGRIPSSPTGTLPTALSLPMNPYVPAPQDTGAIRTTTRNVPAGVSHTSPITKAATGRVDVRYPNSTSHVAHVKDPLEGGSWGEDPSGAKGIFFKLVMPVFFIIVVAAAMYYILIRQFGEDNNVAGDADGQINVVSAQFGENVTPEDLKMIKEELQENAEKLEDPEKQEKLVQAVDKFLPGETQIGEDKQEGDKSVQVKNNAETLSGQEVKATGKTNFSGNEEQKDAFDHDGKTEDGAYEQTTKSVLSSLLETKSDEKTVLEDDGVKKPVTTDEKKTSKDESITAFFEQATNKSKPSAPEMREKKEPAAFEAEEKDNREIPVETEKDDTSVQKSNDKEDSSSKNDRSNEDEMEEEDNVRPKDEENKRDDDVGTAIIIATIDGEDVDGAEISVGGKTFKTPGCEIRGSSFGERSVMLKAFYQDEKRGFFSGEMLLNINWIGNKNIYVEMKPRKEISQAGARLLPLNMDDTVFDTLKGKEGEVIASGKSLIMELLWVEPGSFEMGSEAEGVKEDEKPAHTVQISNGFWMGKYEVTQEEYRTVALSSGLNNDKSYFHGDKLPVENITRDEAEKWCEALTRRERDAGRLPDGYEYRLPTEAEWEFAARGGKKSRGYLFSGSNDLAKVGWFSGNSEGETKEVGLKMENELGFCDMSGNVREWCHDKYEPYTLEPVVDPLGHGTKDISRGGSCLNDKIGCRLTERGSYLENTRVRFIGFRVALAPVLAE